MVIEKVLSLSKIRIASLAQFATLTAVVVAAPFLHNQIITGSIVNAALFISAALLGLEGAILVATLPSLVALLVGTLPIVLAPIIPFIVLSNILLIIIFLATKKTNYWLGVFSASALKFIFLLAASSWAINLLFKKEVAGAAAMMFNWPQLVTALIGGALAYAVLKGGRFLDSDKQESGHL